MQFTINKEYAKAYNEFRKKEELQKLKDRHGDVKLSKKRKHLAEDMSKETDERSEEDGSTESSSDSDDEEEEEDDSSTEEREHEDFLRLYDALCRNDPSLDDPNKQWFHEEEDEANQSNGSAAEGPSNTVSSPAVGKTKHQRKSKDHRPVTLRDHERQFLLEHGGVEDEAVAADADRIAKLESDDVLNKLSHSEADASKAKFLDLVTMGPRSSANDIYSSIRRLIPFSTCLLDVMTEPQRRCFNGGRPHPSQLSHRPAVFHLQHPSTSSEVVRRYPASKSLYRSQLGTAKAKKPEPNGIGQKIGSSAGRASRLALIGRKCGPNSQSWSSIRLMPVASAAFRRRQNFQNVIAS
ncbi:protein KRI1 [Clonorchis sinensis]|uniref:Protein KRI1 n=1 Tax=Clonorchis sinensis TaxID=79923 RepID=G7YW93_CLOSI|nr:protein KRI1 [Clonorchis sinensis]